METESRPLVITIPAPPMPNEAFATWGGVDIYNKVCGSVEVLAGTSAPREVGAQTVLVLHDETGGKVIQAARVIADERGGDGASGLLLVLSGNTEAAMLADALEFAAATIRKGLADE